MARRTASRARRLAISAAEILGVILALAIVGALAALPTIL
jgi:hypothetical protein